MKVFRVTSEYSKEDSDEVVVETQFVTQADDNIVSVTSYMAEECESLGRELKSVEEVLVVCQQIGVQENTK